ncbi:hypothetical protein J1N51_10105 [Psychrosphaera ytuae]|uniref:DUF2178 domain-containing protein n=1 Tax=Psychrosphaera ytuae TaxID=2820710 RepID=A0A975D9J2_9GAMM|nr:hypothetical protein [Psychrosphaera ytuae]QTH63095.1 hypothetical protein J1N51_10105 [Psychrosphaera ytuae]
MSFHEKSAWLMAVILTLCGLSYFQKVFAMSQAAGEVIAPSLQMLSSFTVSIVVLAVIGHIVTAAVAPKEANTDPDERERTIFNKAGNLSGYILGFGAVAGLFHFLFKGDGNLLFYIVFASLLVAQIADYALQIFFYRRGF